MNSLSQFLSVHHKLEDLLGRVLRAEGGQAEGGDRAGGGGVARHGQALHNKCTTRLY